ncbi:hypothetical protein Agub_g5097, partial [Astrephomene gubernaculifera]
MYSVGVNGCQSSHSASSTSARPPRQFRRRLALLGAAAVPLVAATAATASPLQPTRHSKCQHQPSPLTLASTSASAPSPTPSVLDLLLPVLASAAEKWIPIAISAAQRFLSDQLASLHSPDCWRGSGGVLRALLAGAALQLGSLGLATRLCRLEPSAVYGGQWWRLVSWTLVHAGPLHLATNYAALAKLGPQWEQVAGETRFTATYLASAAAATVASLVAMGGPRGSHAASLGASGPVYGIAAALWHYHAVHAGLLPAEADVALRELGGRLAVG